MTVRTRLALCLAGTALLAGCGSATGPTRAATISPSAGTVVHAGPAQNGRTLDLRTGDQLVVQLPSTYWWFAAQPGGSPLQLVAARSGQNSDCAHTVPGSGCGFARAQFRAAHAGTATVTANRTSCGEALRCTGGQGTYRLTLRISG